MRAVVVEIVREVEVAGGRLIPLNDGGLRVTAPEPLPDALVDRLRHHKPAIIDYLALPAPVEPSGWDGEIAGLVRWFLTIHPPTEPFELSRGVTVIKPALWWTVMRRELVLGPQGTPRARTGALQQDLRRLAALKIESEHGKDSSHHP